MQAPIRCKEHARMHEERTSIPIAYWIQSTRAIGDEPVVQLQGPAKGA